MIVYSCCEFGGKEEGAEGEEEKEEEKEVEEAYEKLRCICSRSIARPGITRETCSY